MRPRNSVLVATLAILTGLVSACSDSPETQTAHIDAASETAACFLSAAQSPCQLLTLERAQALFPAARDADINEFVSKYSSSCTVSWAGGRKAGGSGLPTDVNDSLTLSQIRKVNRDAFIRQHRNMSEEEKAHLLSQTDEALRTKTEEGVLDKNHQQAGKDFARTLINKVQWEEIRGLGDRAAWGGVGRQKTLNVLVDNAMFSIRADISDEESKQLAASKRVAQTLIDACH